MAEKKASKADSPPADAPMPTIGKSFAVEGASSGTGVEGEGVETGVFEAETTAGLTVERPFFILRRLISLTAKRHPLSAGFLRVNRAGEKRKRM
jgi:hypothetical protein